MAHAAHMASLRVLALGNTKVTDAGIERIKGLGNSGRLTWASQR